MAAITAFAKLQNRTARRERRQERQLRAQAWEQAADAKARRLGYPTTFWEGVFDLFASFRGSDSF